MRIKISKPTKIALVVSTLFSANSVLANGENTDPSIETIEVKGFRGSLIKAQTIKKSSTSVVEALAAEDIGKLPDSSIAESLARLSGVAGDRQNGRTSGISVRGFKEDYVGSTMNGRELLGIGFNRGVEYDLYPSEIISGATIYKSPDASLSVVGVGGTINLETIRPLNSEPVTSINISGESNTLDSDNPDFDNNGHRIAFNFSNKFLDDTFGVAVAVTSTESPLNYRHTQIYGYRNQTTSGDNYPEQLWPRGGNVRSISEVLERDTFSAVFQYQPNNKLDIVIDTLYVDFANEGISRGFWENWNYANGGEVTGSDNNLATSGKTAPYHATMITNPLINSGDLKTIGLNLSYQLTDDWLLEFDIASSRTNKKSGKAESYAGLGRSGLTTENEAITRDWILGPEGISFLGNDSRYADYDLVKLAGPQAWGGALSPIKELNNLAEAYPGPETVTSRNAQDGFVNTAFIEESLDSARLDLSTAVNFGIFEQLAFGLQFSDRNMSKENFGAFLTAPTFPSHGPIPEDYRLGFTDLSWAGLGSVVAYDAQAMINDGYYKQFDADQLQAGRLADTYDISEKLTMGYLKSDFATDIGSVFLSGNIGVQVIHAQQNAKGWNSFIGQDQFVQAKPVSEKTSYTDVLPSLNLNFELHEDHMFRFAASKVVSRPRFDDMIPGSSIDFNFNVANIVETTPENGPWSSSGGNPKLKPLEANQFDISYEWYFVDDGYLALTYYKKDLVNWHRTGRKTTDFSEFYIPGYHEAVDTTTNEVKTPGTFEGITTFKEDGLQGDVDGFEFAANIPFHIVSDSLEGLGLSYSFSRSDGELDDGSPIPGLSEKVDSLSIFYERNGFSFRVSGTKRSAYETEEKGNTGPASTSKQPIELWDAQIGYDFSESNIKSLEGLSLNLKALNITKEDDLAANSEDARQVLKHVQYGSTYMLQAIYKF